MHLHGGMDLERIRTRYNSHLVISQFIRSGSLLDPFMYQAHLQRDYFTLHLDRLFRTYPINCLIWLYKNVDNHPTHLTKRIQICGKHWELCLMRTNCFTFCLPSWSLIHLFVWFLGKFTHVQQKKGLTLESPPSESILFKWSNSKVIFLHRDISTSCICCRLKALACHQWHFGKHDSYCNHKMLAWLLPVMHKSYYLICFFNNFLQVLLEDIMLLGGKTSAWFHFVVFQNRSPWSWHIGLNQNDYRDYFFF